MPNYFRKQLVLPLSFPQFSQLPTELRCQIWNWAAPRRSRLIQIFYDTETGTWLACKDACGGLPLSLISKESHAVFMKPYSPAFGTLVDFLEDVIFISDPIFTIRQPQNAFLACKSASKLRRIAFTRDICLGLMESEATFGGLCRSLPALLQELGSLIHFIVSVSDDGAEFYFDFPGESDNEEEEEEEGEEEGGDDENGEELENGDGELALDGQDHDQELEAEIIGLDGELLSTEGLEEQELYDLEQEAVATMSKGYFRQVGDIRFEDIRYIDGDEVRELMGDLTYECAHHQDQNPDWVAPKISIMAIRYGLKPIGNFTYPVGFFGDHKPKDDEPRSLLNHFVDVKAEWHVGDDGHGTLESGST